MDHEEFRGERARVNQWAGQILNARGDAEKLQAIAAAIAQERVGSSQVELEQVQGKLAIFEQTHLSEVHGFQQQELSHIQTIQALQQQLSSQSHKLYFGGVPFVLILIDFSYLHNSFKTGLRGIHPQIQERLGKRVPYFSTRPCLIHAYLQEGLPDYAKVFPPKETQDCIVKWFYESGKKYNEKTKLLDPMDVDPQIVAEGTCHINNAGKQILRFVLVSGDKDMSVLLRFAKKRKIPRTIVCYSRERLDPEYAKLATEIISLKTK